MTNTHINLGLDTWKDFEKPKQLTIKELVTLQTPYLGPPSTQALKTLLCKILAQIVK